MDHGMEVTHGINKNRYHATYHEKKPAWGYIMLHNIARRRMKKTPLLQDFVWLFCHSLPDISGCQITPTQLLQAAFLRYHRQHG